MRRSSSQRIGVVAAGLVAAGSSLAALDAAAKPGEAPRFDGWRGPKPQIDCTCRRPGGAKSRLGSVICLERNGKRVLARCEMPQNMPHWRILREGCEGPVS